VNADGSLDLVTTGGVLLGNGDGTFQAPMEYELGSGGETAIDVAAVDLNGDGLPDLAVLDAWGGKVVVMTNQGDGTFTIGTSLRITGGLRATGLTVADFNNDGIPDLAATGDNGVGILLGRGGGTFETMLHYGATGLPFGVAAGDFNGDGFTDLAVAGEHGGIAVLLNAADWPGKLPDKTPPPPPLPPRGGGFARQPSGGDFSGGAARPARPGRFQALPGSTVEPGRGGANHEAVTWPRNSGTTAGGPPADPAPPEANSPFPGPAGRAPRRFPRGR
jgi:hypothetical protein